MSITTTFAPTTTSDSPPVFTPDTGDDGGGGGGGSAMAQRGANYFFGFLITFVVLLLIFVGCGVRSRRRYLARRHDTIFGATLDSPWGGDGGVGGRGDVESQKEPKLFECVVGEARVEDRWGDTSPLSMTLLRQPKSPSLLPPNPSSDNLSPNSNSNLNLNTQENPPPPSAHHRALTTLLTTPFHERKHAQQPIPEKIEYGGPEALDIAVMIVMPSPLHSQYQNSQPQYNSQSQTNSQTNSYPEMNSQLQMQSSRANATHDAEGALPELQIGVATIPWRTEIGSVS